MQQSADTEGYTYIGYERGTFMAQFVATVKDSKAFIPGNNGELSERHIVRFAAAEDGEILAGHVLLEDETGSSVWWLIAKT